MKRGNIALALLLILAPVRAEAPMRVDTPIAPRAAVLSENLAPKRTSLPARGGSFKSFMDYRTITCRTSRQWALQQEATTDEQGLRRLDGRYMVAVGSFYAKEVGTKLIVILENGERIPAIVGDLKADRHTDGKKHLSDGSVVEFIVDTRQLPSIARRLGSVSCLGFEGEVVEIELEI